MRTIVKGKFGRMELSKYTVNNIQLQARKLEEFLSKRGYENIADWLQSNDYAGCRDFVFQQDLLDWSFNHLATDEGFAWLRMSYQ